MNTYFRKRHFVGNLTAAESEETHRGKKNAKDFPPPEQLSQISKRLFFFYKKNKERNILTVEKGIFTQPKNKNKLPQLNFKTLSPAARKHGLKVFFNQMLYTQLKKLNFLLLCICLFRLKASL